MKHVLDKNDKFYENALHIRFEKKVPQKAWITNFTSIYAHFIEYVAWNACTRKNGPWFFNQHHEQNCLANKNSI